MKELKKCVVLSIEGRYIYLLAKGGAFHKVRWRGEPPVVGEEVFLENSIENPFMTRLSQALLVACVALFLLIGASVISYHYTSKEMAYISLDINPSVEFLLNTNNRVARVIPRNENGQQIVKKVRLNGLSGEQAIRAVTNQAIKEGYLNQRDYNVVLLAVTPLDNQRLAPDLEHQYAVEAGKILKTSRLSGETGAIQTTVEERSKANRLGLTSGKYAVWLKAQKMGLKLSSTILREEGISQAIKNAGGDISSILNSINGIVIKNDPAINGGESGQPSGGQQTAPPAVTGPTPPNPGEDRSATNGEPDASLPTQPGQTGEKTSTSGSAPHRPNGGTEGSGPDNRQPGPTQTALDKVVTPVQEKVIKPLDDHLLNPVLNLLGHLL